ncbi:MAG TPA: hypothetical protein VKR55_29435 [Bradyrhizobium sp.]|uniref:DUF2441 domain-containing protein n=1 Tax=Bradyrhizobium sp. TaxID=376 RepID=UPI002CAA1443|nr:hypothetical protein [Bradyrhizobium sp.]HLZ06262.1 hypothetical protein [Bradyrhizobium sp.]
MTDQINDWNGNPVRLRPGTYWHLTPPKGLLLHNAKLGKGVIHSISSIAEQPDLDKVVSPYSIAKMNDPKETLWENIREGSFPLLPSRLKSFYCFESHELADRAAREWFGSEARIIIEARLAHNARIHRCDAKLLEAKQDQWHVNAERYWKGEMTQSPFPETIVHGAIYTPAWETFSTLW